VFTTETSTTVPYANGSKGAIDLFGLTYSRDSALDPIAPDLVETPAPSNHQVIQPETELNCIDQLMHDHIASCLARSIDPFPRESLQVYESHESMYVQLSRLSNIK
jgi:hypothetical protein